LRAEFHLSNSEYGWILTAFSVTYAASAPVAGWLIDRLGLNLGISLAVGLWSVAGVGTGLVRGLAGLAGFRALLGLAEAAGIPAAGKAIHQYLKPEERALGNAVNQAGVSLGAILAPPVATWLALQYNWRVAFLVTGALGFLWIPLWNAVARRNPGVMAPAPQPASSPLELLRSRRMWGFIGANALSMVAYSLWFNWTTLYLVEVTHLSVARAAWFAWIPPLGATLGGFAGGWLSLRGMRRGSEAAAARTAVCRWCAVASLAMLLIPLFHSAVWASAGISWAIFWVAAFSVNMYTMPLDVFGGPRAAFAVSLLVSSYGLMQAIISPLFGALIDAYGYTPVCVLASLAPMAAFGVLKWSE
jgi:ACS family hexuronate transporter-like MFS transporter